MINIIKHGTKEKSRFIFQISCPYCHCVYTAERSDMKKKSKTCNPDLPVWEGFINCPDCKRENHVDSGHIHEIKKEQTAYT